MLNKKSDSVVKNINCQFQFIWGEIDSTNVPVQSLNQIQHSNNILIIGFRPKQFLNLYTTM